MTRDDEILDLAGRIAAGFAPKRIVLFGSHAYGVPTEQSDVDLLIIMPFEGSARVQSLKVWAATRPHFPVDLLVRRPGDTARRYTQWEPLIREALDKGKVLYERDGAGVGGQGRGRLPRSGGSSPLTRTPALTPPVFTRSSALRN